MLMIEDPRVEPREVMDVLRRAFGSLASGATCAPGQFVVDLPDGGDVIHYPGLLCDEGVYAVKVSPYLPQQVGRAIVSAWTLLISTETGQPLALLDAGVLTTERTAATSVLAADLLLAPDAQAAAIVGLGPVGRAHARYLRQARPGMTIRGWTRTLPDTGPAGVALAGSIQEAIAGADLVMLCTSAAADVLDPRTLDVGTVVTSISTNAPGAREIPAAAVRELDVYLDAAGTLGVATELREAAKSGWDTGSVRGTLADLVAGRSPASSGERVRYFRSVGLGIGDAAVAWAAYQTQQREKNA